jgi:hypothetical protein
LSAVQLDQAGSAGLYGQKKNMEPDARYRVHMGISMRRPLRRIAQGESGPTQPLTIALAGFKPALRGGLIFSSIQGPA